VTLATWTLAGLAVCVFATPVHAQWLNYKTPGIPRTANGSPDLSAPLPRANDGKPDLTGVWSEAQSASAPPKLQSGADALSKQRMDDLRRDSPEALCLPGPITSMGVGSIVQTPGLLLMLYSGTSYREIFLDGRPLPKDPNPGWMGYSVGRWAGDTLIVDTIGFNERTWLRGNGVPGSPQLRITERIHRSDFGHLEIKATYVDPTVMQAPWEVTTQYLLTDIQPLEYVCNENERDRPHIIGKASDLQSLPLDPKLLAGYAGSYEYNARVYVFTVLQGQLSVSIGRNTFLLTTLSETAFGDNNGIRYDFFRDPSGAVSHVIARTFDGDIEATRRN
jgi:hypothetical protein